MATVWYNHGYSSVRDALIMIREGARDAGLPLHPETAGLRLIASHRDPQAAVLDVADLAFIEPRFKRDTEEGAAEFVAWCLDVCRIHGVDLFVPQNGRALIATHAAAFEAIGTRVSVPASSEMLALIEDKAAFYEAALEVGLPMPLTIEVRDAIGFDAAVAEVRAAGLNPCVKPPEGVFGAGFWMLDDGCDLFSTLMNPEGHVIATEVVHRALAEPGLGKRLLVMEHLAGVEWSLDCVCRDGELIVGVARRKEGRAQRLETDGPAFEIGRRAIAAFGLSGLINLQCRAARIDDSDPRLLEINTRMSGGCVYTRFSGALLPWYHVATELGLIAPGDIPDPQPGALVAAIGDAVLIADRTMVDG